MRDPVKGRFEKTISRSMVAEDREIALRLLKEHSVPQLDRSVL